MAAAHTRSSVSSPQGSPASLAASRAPTQTRTLAAARPLSTLSPLTLSSRSSFPLEHVHLTLTFSLPSAFRQHVSSVLRPTLLSHSYATPSPLTLSLRTLLEPLRRATGFHTLTTLSVPSKRRLLLVFLSHSMSRMLEPGGRGHLLPLVGRKGGVSGRIRHCTRGDGHVPSN